MISTLHCNFIKLYQGVKKDNSKYFILTVAEENEKTVINHKFFIDNELALNLDKCVREQKITVTFEIWFGSNDTMLYKIKQIIIEK